MSKPTLKATFNIFKSYAIHPIKLMHKQERKKKNVYVFQEQEPARKRNIINSIEIIIKKSYRMPAYLKMG